MSPFSGEPLEFLDPSIGCGERPIVLRLQRPHLDCHLVVGSSCVKFVGWSAWWKEADIYPHVGTYLLLGSQVRNEFFIFEMGIKEARGIILALIT